MLWSVLTSRQSALCWAFKHIILINSSAIIFSLVYVVVWITQPYCIGAFLTIQTQGPSCTSMKAWGLIHRSSKTCRLSIVHCAHLGPLLPFSGSLSPLLNSVFPCLPLENGPQMPFFSGDLHTSPQLHDSALLRDLDILLTFVSGFLLSHSTCSLSQSSLGTVMVVLPLKGLSFGEVLEMHSASPLFIIIIFCIYFC